MAFRGDSLNSDLLDNFYVPYALKRVDPERISGLIPFSRRPQVGDLALTRVISVGRSKSIELTNGRMATIYPGSLIAVAFGHRYATSQYEAVAAADNELCDLLTAAGIAGLVVSKKETTRPPTKLMVVGFLSGLSGEVLNLKQFALPSKRMLRSLPRITTVCGSSMNSGKTYTASAIIRSFSDNGFKVGAAKITGTAAGKDVWNFIDAGAYEAYDFSDFGYPSTVGCSRAELLNIYESALARLAEGGAERVVIEIADGILQTETDLILKESRFTSSVESIIYCAADPLAISGGVSHLRGAGIEPTAVSGLVCRSPLAVREAIDATGLLCVRPEHLYAEVLVDQQETINTEFESAESENGVFNAY